jgi:hypothetical protein
VSFERDSDQSEDMADALGRMIGQTPSGFPKKLCSIKNVGRNVLIML